MSNDCYAIVNKVLLALNFLIYYTGTYMLSLFIEFKKPVIEKTRRLCIFSD